MADEVLGSIYEVLTIVAIEDYTAIVGSGESLFWEEYPKGVSIKPDITIGVDKDKPRILLLVHHTNAERASEKKFWRNIGELVDARLALGATTTIANVVFESIQKKKLIAASKAIFDGFLEVHEQPYGAAMSKLTAALAAQAISGKVAPSDRANMIRAHLKAHPSDEAIAKLFAADIIKLVSSSSKFASNWFGALQKLQPLRPPLRVPKARVTTVRRGLGRLLPIDDEQYLRQLLADIRVNTPRPVPSYLIDLGLAVPDAGGKRYRIVGKEILGLLNIFDDNLIVDFWKKARASSKAVRQASDAIRHSDDFPRFHSFVATQFHRLSTATDLEQALRDCYLDPNNVLGAPIGLSEPKSSGAWLFNYLMTIIKAEAKKQQGYGYSRLTKEAGLAIPGKRSILDFALPKYITRTKPLDAHVYEGVARALSVRLSAIGASWITGNEQAITDAFLRGLFEDKIYKMAAFDPTRYQLEAGLKKPSFNRRSRKPTFLTQVMAETGVTTTDVIEGKNTLLLWQSATNKGVNHKMKELCGRLGMLRVKATPTGAAPDTGYKKAILLLDGTWTDAHLKRLADCGADAIFYPDEIDDLIKAIV